MNILDVVIFKSLSSIIKNSIERLFYKNKSYKQIIYNDENTKIKEDIVQLKYNLRTQKIKGTIIRQFPINEVHRSWEFDGIIRNGIFFITFCSDDLVKNPNSYGSIQLESINNNYVGKYIKPYRDNESNFKVCKIEWTD